MTEYFALITTCSSEEEAERIAEVLVQKRIAACANWWPVNSVYWWEGECERAEEYMVFAKTVEMNLESAEKAIRSIHSYENPEVISIRITGGSEDYLRWVEDSVR